MPSPVFPAQVIGPVLSSLGHPSCYYPNVYDLRSAFPHLICNGKAELRLQTACRRQNTGTLGNGSSDWRREWPWVLLSLPPCLFPGIGKSGNA